MDAAWYYKIAAGGETGVTSADSADSGNQRGIVHEYEGPFDGSPLDVTAENESNVSSATTSQASGTTATTAVADALALAFFAGDSAFNLIAGRSYTNSFSEDQFAHDTDVAARAACILARRVLTATGTYSTTFSTTDTGDEMYGSIAVFKKAAAAGATVSLDSLTLVSTIPALTAVPGAVSILLDALSLVSNAESLTVVPGAVAVLLDTLTLASSLEDLDVVTGTVVALAALTLTSSAEGLAVSPGAVSVLLDALTLAGSVPALSVVPGAVTVALASLTLASSIEDLNATLAAIYIYILTEAVIVPTGAAEAAKVPTAAADAAKVPSQS